jgi:phospholipase/carboxylesterase
MHGAGGNATSMLQRFIAEADRRGIVLLSLKSRRYSWDAVMAFANPVGTLGVRPPRAYEDDPPRIEAALNALIDRVAIDPERIGLAGFSDGASYALAIGAANPQIFHFVIAFSPGLNLARRDSRCPGLRVFISHGLEDPVLPYSVAHGEISERIRALGASLTFRTFSGVHEIPQDVASEALDQFESAS